MNTSGHTATPPAPFPSTFWWANVTELFERAAYYSIASFVVIYLGQIGMGKFWPSFINGTVLWGLIYFLPVLSGTIADQIGFKRSLLIAFILLLIGYFLMGTPVWFLGSQLNPNIEDAVSAGPSAFVPVIIGVLLIGIGGSFVKPCISGTVQKTHSGRATLAFAIFYMVVNIGSVVGRIVAFFVRKGSNISFIYAVGMAGAVIAFFVVLFFYKDPERLPSAPKPEPAKPKRTFGEALIGIGTALTNVRFLLFLLVSSGFWFLYTQVYNVLPLYTKQVLETNPPMEIYTAFNPITIVCFQLLITKLFGKMKPIRSIVVGTVIIGLAMLVNLVPLYAAGGPRAPFIGEIPIGSVFIMLTVSLIAFGELFTSARTFEWIGSLAPKGQEGLFLGYANLPTAVGAMVGGPVGAWIFNKVMSSGAETLPNKLLDQKPTLAAAGWLILMGIGFLSAFLMWLYNRWLERHPA